MAIKLTKKIALFAGSGNLPVHIIEHCNSKNIPLVLFAIEGQTPQDLISDNAHHWVPFGAIGQILKLLKQESVTHIVLAGTMHRPSFKELGLDWVGTTWIAKVGLKSLGDDGLLTAVTQLLESEGFQILAPHDILGNILMPEGVLGEHSPNEEDWNDIKYGSQILSRLGDLDVGQAIVIQRGIVLAIEAIEGTDKMLQRAGLHKRADDGGVLVKQVKSTQNRKVDLPTIGLQTIIETHAAGLRGIATSAHSTQIIEKQSVIEKANELGLFVVGFMND